MRNLLIAGTDTNVGKTWVTTALVSYFLTYYPDQSLGLIKLMQTGTGDDEHYRQIFAENPQIESITPLKFIEPLAPPIAAEKEGKPVDLKIIWQTFTDLQEKHSFVIAEGLGGLGSPVSHELTVADLAGSWRLNTILVVPVKLGAIAQAVGNVSYARSCKIKLKGIILNCIESISPEKIDELTPCDLIQSLTQVPVLGILPYLETVDQDKMAHTVSNWQIEGIIS